MNYKSFARRSSVLGGIFTVLLSLSVSASAQWNSITSGQTYTDENNWVNRNVNDRFVGGVNANSFTVSAEFAAGATTIYTGAFDARKLTVGEAISGSGIPAGATITAINNAGQITISAPTTSASNGPLTVSGWGYYQFTGAFQLNVASRAMPGDFVMLYRDNFATTFTPNSHKWTFSQPVTNFVVDLAGSGTKGTFNFGADSRGMVLDFGGGIANFIIDPSTNFGSDVGLRDLTDALMMATTGTNLTALNKSGAGIMRLGGNASHVFYLTGANAAVTVTGGQLQLATGANTLPNGRVAGASRFDIIGPGTALALSYENSAVVDPADIAGGAAINLWSAQLAMRPSATSNNLAVSDVTLRGGRNSIVTTIQSATATITLKSLTRENHATLNLQGGTNNNETSAMLGSGSNGTVSIKVTNDANILGSLVGGGGVRGTKTVSILPWAVGSGSNYTSGWTGLIQGDAFAWSGIDLVTYTHDGGFRILEGSEYDNTLAAAATTGVSSNLWLTGGATATASQTVNALKLSPGAGLTVNSGATLTVTSGVLLRGYGNGSSSALYGTGTVSSGAAPMYIYGSGLFNINTTLTNSVTGDGPGLILAQPFSSGSTVLTGSNNYGGWTLVQGAVSLQSNYAITNSELRVDLGGLVTVDKAGVNVQVTKLSGNGTVNLLPSGLAQLNIGGPAGANGAITVNAGGILAPGDAAGQLQAGTLWLGDRVESLVFKQGSLLSLDLASDTLSDMVSSLNPFSELTLSDGAILRLNFLNGYAPTDEVSWLLTSGFDSLSLGDYIIQDQAGNVLDDYTLTKINNNLMLSYSAIPEPSALLLTVSGLALLAFLSRRR